MGTGSQEEDVVSALRSRIDGSVLTAGDDGYDQARTTYFALRDGRPIAVVRPKHADDVAATVDVARRTQIPLFVRSGGHSGAAHSTGNGLLLDLSSLKGLEVDVAGRTAWAETGLTAGEVTQALTPHGLVIGFGDTGTVGIGGITLGGGVGFLSRLHGMTIDNVLAAEIVTADGQVKIVDAQHEPDLFWAIRGGGGNFGVVTRFRFRLAELPQVHGGVLVLPATARAIDRLASACLMAEDGLSVIVNIMPAPPINPIPAELHGQLVMVARVCYAGHPDAAEKVLRPLRDAAPPLVDLVAPMPYAAMFEVEAPDAGNIMAVRTMFLDRIDEGVGATMLDHLNRSDSWMRVVQFRILGGAISRLADDATAYAHRTSRIMLTVIHVVESDAGPPTRWTQDLADALQQEDAGAYVNFFGPADGDRVPAAYPGETLARLRRIKAKHDPTNLFSNNDNIRPG
jgi:hypothetical protein